MERGMSEGLERGMREGLERIKEGLPATLISVEFVILVLTTGFPSGLCPDWDQWDQSKPVDNAREAMQQADDWLGIPQVEDPPSDGPFHMFLTEHLVYL